MYHVLHENGSGFLAAPTPLYLRQSQFHLKGNLPRGTTTRPHNGKKKKNGARRSNVSVARLRAAPGLAERAGDGKTSTGVACEIPVVLSSVNCKLLQRPHERSI